MEKRIIHIFLLMVIISCFSCSDEEVQTPFAAVNELQQLQQLKQEIAKYPDSLLLVEKLIQYYRNKGAYDSAITVTDGAIKRGPNVVDLWDIKAILHFENGDTINAISSFESAIDIFPLPEYLISLGTLYAQTKNPKALIIADALMLAENAKAGKEAFFIKGLYYNYIGNKKKAIALFDRSTAKNKKWSGKICKNIAKYRRNRPCRT